MAQYELVPHVRVGGVHFGMLRDEVRRALGAPSYVDTGKDFFDGSALHVHYDASTKVQLVVVARATGGEALLVGVDLLGVEAEVALSVVGQTAEVDRTDPEFPLSCTFPTLDLNLWRACLPEDSDGVEGRHFDAVGLGVRGYFSRTKRN
jgi:hypothetical protein